jgi:hypothetical protein
LSYDIHNWQDIKKEYGGTILLGNGGSIAVDSKFSYGSLKQHATDNGLLTDDVQAVFDFFHTDDFELILRIVWQATNVNKSLTIDDEKTEKAYIHVRDCLIGAVRDIHSEHGVVSDQIPAIYEFLKEFETVVSLNYDLIVYWTMMYGLDVDDKHAFKDCFIGSEFDDDWQRFRDRIWEQETCSLVFYPHGSLIFARDKIENERKISSDGMSLLEGILSKWEKGSYVPLFVSEGTSEQKIKSIHSSYYLNTVYREVLSSLSSDLVLYGWGLGEHDLHIIKRIAKSGIKNVAVSVFGNDQAYCNRVHQTLKDEFGDKCVIKFFDSQSDGCWNKST